MPNPDSRAASFAAGTPASSIGTLWPNGGTRAITAASTNPAPLATMAASASRLVFGETELMSMYTCPGFSTAAAPSATFTATEPTTADTTSSAPATASPRSVNIAAPMASAFSFSFGSATGSLNRMS